MDKIEKVGVIGVVVGMVVMMLMFSLTFVVMAGQDEVDIFGTSFVRVGFEQEDVVGFGCLTSLDLNRDDLWDVVFLSHDCEAMGYMTVPYWQEDEEGNQFFIPVCVEVDG